MTPAHDTPLALIGYPAGTGRLLRDLGLNALCVPQEPLSEVLAACVSLAFRGALVASGLQSVVLSAVQPDAAALRAGAADALAFVKGGQIHAAHTLQDALQDALEDSGYPVRGARALLIGEGSDLSAGLALTRLGLSSLTLAAASLPQAEALARGLPAGLNLQVTSRSDPALSTLAERADLVVLTAGVLPPGVLHPFHALIDLTGRAERAALRAGATSVPLTRLPELRLARRLHHATGERFLPDILKELAQVLN